MQPARIGLDLDGTIALYGDVFHRCATTHFAMPAQVPVDKSAIRQWFLGSAAGHMAWTELQGLVYGPHMGSAKIAPGLTAFLRFCRAESIAISVISHKTQFAERGPRFDLHQSAWDWLGRQGLFDEGLVDRSRVFFEPDRDAKVARIAAEGCTAFVDDLEEVLTHESFPIDVERILYAPGRVESLSGKIKILSDWDRVKAFFQRRAQG